LAPVLFLLLLGMITVGSIVEKGRGSIPGTCGSALDIYGRCTAASCSLQVTEIL